MTPSAYIQALPRAKRTAERQRLAKIAGVSVATMRHYTEVQTLEDGTSVARRHPGDAETCQRLQKATRDLVTVAEWNPRYAPLVKT